MRVGSLLRGFDRPTLVGGARSCAFAVQRSHLPPWGLYVDSQTAKGQHKGACDYDHVGKRSSEYRVYADRTGLSRLKAGLRTGIVAA
jgi:hypothetical protein